MNPWPNALHPILPRQQWSILLKENLCSSGNLFFIIIRVKPNLEGRKSYFSYLGNPGRDISFPILTRKEIETKIIRKEIKTIISRLNHFLSFFPIYSRKEIETRILERKSKQKISRYIDLIYRLFNIMLGSNWLIFFTNGRPGIY